MNYIVVKSNATECEKNVWEYKINTPTVFNTGCTFRAIETKK